MMFIMQNALFYILNFYTTRSQIAGIVRKSLKRIPVGLSEKEGNRSQLKYE